MEGLEVKLQHYEKSFAFCKRGCWPRYTKQISSHPDPWPQCAPTTPTPMRSPNIPLMSWCTISPEEDDWGPALGVSIEPNMKKQWTVSAQRRWFLLNSSHRQICWKSTQVEGRQSMDSSSQVEVFELQLTRWEPFGPLNLDACFLLSRINRDLDKDYFFKTWMIRCQLMWTVQKSKA